MNVLGTAVFELATDASKFNRDLDSAESKARGTSDHIGSAFDGIGKKAALAFGAAGAAGAVATFAKDSFNAFAGFDSSMREVFTLLPGISGDAMGQMKQQVLDFSNTFGVLPEQEIPSLYQALSAGIPQENVFTFLETAQKAAIGGASDLETAVDGLSSVVNAYGEDVLSASQASDVMFTGIRLGKTTMDELSSGLSQVVPVAASLKVNFGDITAALATMTAQGTNTAQATTQLRQALIEVSDSGTEVGKIFQTISGQSFAEFIASGHNLQDVFTLLSDYARRSGKDLRTMFGSVEAGQAVLQLTGRGADIFARNLDEMGKSAGATDKAFATMDEGVKRSLDRVRANFRTMQIELGEKLAPAVAEFTDRLVEDMPKIADGLLTAADSLGTMASKASDVNAALQGSGWQSLIGLIAGGKLAGAPGALIGAAIAPSVLDAAQSEDPAKTFGEDLAKQVLEGFSAYALGNKSAISDAIEELFPSHLADPTKEFADAQRDANIAFTEGHAVLKTYGVDVNDLNYALSEGKGFADGYGASVTKTADGLGSIHGPAQQGAFDLNAVADAFDRAQEAQLRSQYTIGTWTTVQGYFDQQLQSSQQAVSLWEGKLKSANDALDILNEKSKTAAGLTKEEAGQRELLQQAVGRYSGAIKDDLNPAVVEAAAAEARLTFLQDDLNKKLAAGEITQEQYNQAITDATTAIDPATAAIKGLQTAQEGVANAIGIVVTRVEDLLVQLGLIPPKKTVTFEGDAVHFNEDLQTVLNSKIPGKVIPFIADTDAFDRSEAEVEGKFPGPKVVEFQGDAVHFDETFAAVDAQQVPDKTAVFLGDAVHENETFSAVQAQQFDDKTVTMLGDNSDAIAAINETQGAINSVDKDFTITAHVDLSEMYAQLDEMNANMPHSPAKKGPFRTLPNWQALFEEMPVAAEDASAETVDVLDSGLVDMLAVVDDTAGDTADALDVVTASTEDATKAAEEAAQAFNQFLTSLRNVSLDAFKNIDKLADPAYIAGLERTARTAQAAFDAAVRAGAPQDIIEELARQSTLARSAWEQAGALTGDAYVQALRDEIAAADTAQKIQDAERSAWTAALNQTDRILADPESARRQAQAAVDSLATQLRLATEEGAPQAIIDGLTVGLAGKQAELEHVGALIAQATQDGLIQALPAMSDATLAQIDTIMESAADRGKSLIPDLVDAIASGRASIDQISALLNADLIPTLEDLESKLLTDLADALVKGTDPSGIEKNLQIIDALLNQLDAKVGSTGLKEGQYVAGLGYYSGSPGAYSNMAPGNAGIIGPPSGYQPATPRPDLSAILAGLPPIEVRGAPVTNNIDVTVEMDSRAIASQLDIVQYQQYQASVPLAGSVPA